ncbi:hypothetical protein ACP4OV_029046 [Aristida adscensionis]
MPELRIEVYTVKEAIKKILPYLKDTGNSAYKAIYFNGWVGLAASAVLRAIAEHPPPSLMKKFDRIFHIDCSRWESRRALQRAIVDELKLPQSTVAALDRQDEKDDFSGIDESTRAEVADVTREIYQTISGLSCLVIFQNGSDNTVDMVNFGFPQFDWGSPSRVLWTFRGRLRLKPKLKTKVDISHLYMYCTRKMLSTPCSRDLLVEAGDVVHYTKHRQRITPEIAYKCFLYLLLMNQKGGGIMDYNWPVHASNYWVCDGIIKDGEFDEAWEDSAALHQEIRIDECSFPTLRLRDDVETNQWKSVTYTSDSGQSLEINIRANVSPELTSFFLTVESGIHAPLPSDMFKNSDRLGVLKLCGCTFSFYLPPFCCCRSLRFLGLHRCKDQLHEGEKGKQKGQSFEFFKSLWVIDISETDWMLELWPDIIDEMAGNTREDEFSDMVKLELLDLSRNSSIQVLPSLSGTTCLKSLVLDGCVGLEHVGPEGLPPLLESFSFDVESGQHQIQKAKISRITLDGCAKLVDFRLQGSLPNLEELDLSCTFVKMLELKNVVHTQKLQRIFLIGCKKLRSISWPAEGMPQLRLLCVDTGGGAVRKTSQSHDFLVPQEQETYCHAFVAVQDMRFLQSLVLTSGTKRFCWSPTPFKLNLCLSSTSNNDGENYDMDMMVPYSTGPLVWSPIPKLVMSKTCCTYNDVNVEQVTANIDGRSELQLQPLDCHVEIGEGMISGTDMQSAQAIKAKIFVMNKIKSLHVHDNCSIRTIILEQKNSEGMEGPRWVVLKWCCIERCRKLDTVFTIDTYKWYLFRELETLCVTDLLMARSIWSKVRTKQIDKDNSFAKLRAIYLQSCTRITFVLPFS